MKNKKMFAFVMIVLLLAVVSTAGAATNGFAPWPVLDVAPVIDGFSSPGEWNDAAEVEMYKAWNSNFEHLATAWRGQMIAGDVVTGYVRVEVANEGDYLPDPANMDQSWIKLTSALTGMERKGVLSEFAVIYDNGVAVGWEAAFTEFTGGGGALLPVTCGNYTHEKIHTNVYDGEGTQTAGASNPCGVPTSVSLQSFEASANGLSTLDRLALGLIGVTLFALVILAWRKKDSLR